MSFARTQRSLLPGFGLSLGFTLAYLGLIVLVPLSAAFLKTAGMSWHDFWATVTAPRVLASYRISFGASLLAGAINAELERQASALERLAWRWGQTDDLKGICVFLASAASDYMNGFTVAVDGGWLAR